MHTHFYVASPFILAIEKVNLTTLSFRISMVDHLKDTELKILAELLKNSKKSDRELAKIIGVSQPTVTRTRARLEKEGYINEYTILPNFAKIGFNIMALTFVKMKKQPTEEDTDKLKKYAADFFKKHCFAIVLAREEMGLGFDNVTISFHKDYDAYLNYLRAVRATPYADMIDFDNFMISLSAKEPFISLTHSLLAKCVGAQAND